MIEIKEHNGITIGKLADTNRLNAAVAPEVKSDLTDALANKGVKLVLDLSNVDFIDSTGIGTLISALKTSRQNGCSFQLCCVKPEVMSLLKLMKLDKIFDIYDNIDQL